MTKFPSIFVSHGSPTLAADGGPACEFLSGLGQSLGRPRAVLCISAHWEHELPTVSAAVEPPTIHDFLGFPEELYQQEYPAPGDPELAGQILALLRRASLTGQADATRGLDHGAWVPLSLMYPDADIPVVQLSVQTSLGAQHHAALGRALTSLRQEGVLILGSGGATHNLAGVSWGHRDAAPPAYAADFERWLIGRVECGDAAALLGYEQLGPDAKRNHPTAEHFLPLLVAQAAGGPPARGQAAVPGRVIHRSFTYSTLSMAAFAWGDA